MVRVPRHLINLKTVLKFPNYKGLNLIINSKWSDEARDYGNGNRTYNDERTKKYFVNDLNINYNFYDTVNFILISLICLMRTMKLQEIILSQNA